MRSGRTDRCFTLVELLMVVAIVSLLLAMLSPSLSRARRLTRAAACTSHLHQIGVGHHTYASASNGIWIPTVSRQRQWWTTSLQKYIANRDILFCPEATRMVTAPQVGLLMIGGRSTGWFDGRQYPSDPLDRGSYGQNMWLNHYDLSIQNWSQPEALHFGGKVGSILQGELVPVVGECHWVGGYPRDTDVPWDHEWDQVMYSGHMLNRFAMNRHDGRAGLVFFDGHASLTPLPDMWGLIWHKGGQPRDVLLPWLD